jgi:hypothetical protein
LGNSRSALIRVDGIVKPSTKRAGRRSRALAAAAGEALVKEMRQPGHSERPAVHFRNLADNFGAEHLGELVWVERHGQAPDGKGKLMR